MCAIAGLLGERASREGAEALIAPLAHRGPKHAEAAAASDQPPLLPLLL